jgi:hypothetical protein
LAFAASHSCTEQFYSAFNLILLIPSPEGEGTALHMANKFFVLPLQH